MISRTSIAPARPRSSLLVTTLALSLGGLLAACGGGSDTTSSGGAGGTGGTGGSGGAGGAEACATPPAEIPSIQAVEVDIQNTTAADRYVLLACQDCEPLRVAKMGDLDYIFQPLVIPADLACGCECPPPPVGYPLAYHRIKPGESFTAAWDARVLALCTYDQDCGGGMTAPRANGALQPVPPGDYRVELGIVENLFAECTQTGDTDDFTCVPPAQPGINPGGGWLPVEITLPASGDVSAQVSIQ